MKIYNTLTHSVEEFIPNNGKDVLMYTFRKIGSQR